MTTKTSGRLEPRVRTRQEVQAHAQTLTTPMRRAMAAVADSGEGADTSTPAGAVGELWLYGVVGGWWRGFDAESVANALRGMDVDTLYVRIHSPGGLAPDGVAIGNLLRNHRANVVVIIDGLAASAASVIAVAGDEVLMCPGSQMMLHDASTIGFGNAADLREAADWIDGQSDNYAGVYAYRAGGTAAQWREVMTANNGRGTWYTADGAVEAKLADSVGTRPAIGSPPVAPEDDLEDLDGDEELLARVQHDLELLDRYVHPTARAVWNGERPKTPERTSAVGQPPNPTETESAVAFSDEQMKTMRAKLGIAEDADETTIVAALSEALDEQAAPAPKTAEVPDGYALVPEQALNDLKTNATLGAQAAEQLRVKDRDEFLDAHRTKFPPASRDSWADAYDRDPKGTREWLEAAAEIVPIEELGHAEDTEAEDEVTESAAYQNWSF